MVEIYWGAKQICARVGYRDHRRLPHLILQYGLPAFRRRNPKRPPYRIYYSDESMITAWLLARAKLEYERLKAKALEKQEQ
ncbi:MAG: hypothetical protein V3S24_08090 [Candidatus Tectomicrobia bacterium]